jgi:hypothetical protein
MTAGQSSSPIFVVGSPRSGTTLLRFILSSHPRMYIPAETGFIPSLAIQPGERLTEAQVGRLLHSIGRLNREWAGLVPDPAAFYQSLPSPTPETVLDQLYRIQIAPYQAARWGDKTPAYVLHIPLLDRLFPQAQFIHIIRDGRDVTLSAGKKWGQAWYMDDVYLLKNWVQYVQAGQDAGRALGPGRYLEIRYEELVQEPEAAVGQICAFLGEEMVPEMLMHQELARQQIGDAGHVEVRRPIATTSVARWQQEMAPFSLKLANQIAGRTLGRNGYELAAVGPFTPAERLRYWGLSAKAAAVRLGRRGLTQLGALSLNRRKRQRGF